ncbi:MAG: AAA family ATPase, partial [Victivallaceae bacterium]
NFLRLDMSEFSRQAGEEALMNLIGTPGGKSTGRLGAFLENCAEGIILYDEIEKSHPAIFTIMLQQLDAARITLSNNKTYDLSNFFIVATSNIGAQVFQNIRHLSERRLRQTLEMQLKERFSPEFVARFGKFGHEILIFHPLKPEHLRQIARKFYSLLLPQYKKSHGIDIFGFTSEVVEETLRSIDNTRNGARELRSNIERKVRELIYNVLMKSSEPIRGWLDVNCQNPNQLQLQTNSTEKELVLCQSLTKS